MANFFENKVTLNQRMCRLSLSTSIGVSLHKKYDIARKELYAHNENASRTPSSKVLRYKVNKFFDVHVHKHNWN